MTPATVANLLDTLRELRLLDAGQLQTLARGRHGDPQALARSLIDQGWLTPFQVNQLLRGKGSDLVLGSYVLLERLGGGGMGEVFKARHLKSSQVVALKVVRKDKLQNPNALRRFQREIQAVAQLNHPNIVQAFDADEASQAAFFAMEYVDGIDLDRHVRGGGPLPVDQAVAYIRQAALGLQHAHERGLVHRDIKPANLFVTRETGLVKVLDMGLAHLQSTDDQDSLPTLTQEGSVVGTLDYLAPEQALNSHQVDTRADLYSLGCTFYFLLTGKAPFPGGTAAEKLMRHRLEEPAAVEKLRPEVPARLAGIIRKLMAKRPEARYQRPAELIAALDGVHLPARRPWFKWAIAAAAVLVGLLGILALNREPPIHPKLGYAMKRRPADAVAHAGHYYQFFPQKLATWEEARQRCQELGGYLACPQNAEELDFLSNLAAGKAAWLGGQSGERNQWVWITGEPFPPKPPGFFWLPGQPNNGANAFLQLGGFGDGKRCHDVGVNEQNRYPAGFVCEWEH